MKTLIRLAIPAALAVSSLALSPAAHADDISFGGDGCRVTASTGTVHLEPNGGGVLWPTVSPPPTFQWEIHRCL